MSKLIKIYVAISMALINGCHNEKTIVNEPSSEEYLDGETFVSETSSVLVNDSFKDGLLLTNNEFSLETKHLILDKNHKKVGEQMNPLYIVIHNTANNASSENEVKYLHSKENKTSTSFHFAVDDKNVYQAINLKYNAWHAGNIEMNKKSIGIEIAKSTINDNKIKNKAIDNGARLVAMLAKEYDISVTKIMTHQQVNGKHCPHDILDRYGYDNFIKLVKSYL